jgi:hypothetical protein
MLSFELLILELNPFVYLFAMHSYLLGRAHTDTHLITLDTEHGHLDVLTDHH